MKKQFLSTGLALTYFAFNSLIVQAESRPPSEIDRAKIIEMSQQVLNLPDMKVKEKEDAEVIPFPDQGDDQRKVAAEASGVQAKKKAKGAKSDVMNVAKYMFQHKQLGPALAKIKG